MIRKFQIAVALTLLTAIAVPTFSSVASAGDYAQSRNYDHKHDTNGW
jgi:hypothetical protein